MTAHDQEVPLSSRAGRAVRRRAGPRQPTTSWRAWNASRSRGATSRPRGASGRRCSASDCTIFFGIAGALSAGGLRLVVAHLLEHRYIDCLVSTGANLYHDLHETRGRHHYIGSPREDDAALQAEHIDRVYDTYASEDEFVDNDEWIAAFALTLERRPYTSREFLYKLGESPVEGDRQRRAS